MNLVRFIDFLRGRLNLVIKVCLGLLALLALINMALPFLSHGHEAEAVKEAGEHAEAAHGFWQQLYHYMETIPALWSVFGFIACVLIVYISKWFGHMKVPMTSTQIMAKEDFYNE